MAPPLLQLRDLHLVQGRHSLLRGASLQVAPGERLCLVGRNGCGKSTLLKVAAGLLEVDRGERFFQPGATVHYLAQDPCFNRYESAADVLRSVLSPAHDWHQALQVLQDLGLNEQADPKTLSGGERRRLALACALALEPDLLLLDEPTNHLDLPTIEWLENELLQRRSALLVISHDRRFLNRVARSTLWLDQGEVRRVDQPFEFFEAWRDAWFDQQEQQHHKRGRQIAREMEWLNGGVTARRKRNQRRLKDLQRLRDGYRRQFQRDEAAIETYTPETYTQLVMNVRQLGFSWPGVDASLIKSLSMRIKKGDRVAIVGANGSGKTTLVNLLLGSLIPTSGTIKRAAHLDIALLDQHRAQLRSSDTVMETLTGGRGDFVQVGEDTKHAISYMRDFLFTAEQAHTPVSHLSGGERARLLLAKILAQPSHLMVLDEPTNDLDLETLDLLQESLSSYGGTLLLVSHDRDFIDRVATHVLIAEGHGIWNLYAGGYSDMLVQRSVGLFPETASQPTKVTTRVKMISKTDVSSVTAVTERLPRKTRLSFKEQHALEKLPAQIDELSAAIARLTEQLSDASLYTTDPRKFTQLSENMQLKQKALEVAETEWLELSLKQEDLCRERES